ncbi:Chondro-6-sulfatase [Salmonella enterica subsp. enterica]|uniref:Chondro-6-sulfatase n=1 Tax=Salmonella enterica I TaxID=59201 RepID=A0A3S4LWR9_SALET|nr:Chondro-6-sulfatase [Salmonella enterica subsp. enterica]
MGRKSFMIITGKRRQGGRLFSRVVNAIRLLQANDVEFNTLTVVNDASCCHGNAIYHFLTQELESKHLQFYSHC